jgi:phosphate transport system permease protein
MRDRLVWSLSWGTALLTFTLFIWMLMDLVSQGAGYLNWSFIFTAPQDAGRAGGISTILVSTLLILSVALVTALPIGLGAAIWLTEYTRKGGHLGRAMHISLDVLAGVPSIVFGLFGYAFFSLYLNMGFSILSGGLTLACMMLPILIRTSEAGLDAVSDDWRWGAEALGMTRASALWYILLPAAAPAITAGLLLAIGRATAETAALIFTSGYVDRMPESLLDSGRAIAVHIYDLSMNVTGGDKAAYGSALVLVCLIILINTSVMLMSERWRNRRITT